VLVLALAIALAVEGRPLFYWGARPPVIAAERPAGESAEAQVTEVHAALDKGTLVVRFTLDRAVHAATHLPDGRPVSGRLRAVLYIDTDAERLTGLGPGSPTALVGADRRLEIGSLYVGEDEEEARPAEAFVTAALALLRPGGGRRTLWRGDHAATPANVSAHGPWIEVRLPPIGGEVEPGARLVLVTPSGNREGSLSSR
jgi:hypothetical protein